MTIRVLVVDDSSFFRRRLTEILSQDAELEVIATANNGKEAVEKALALRPDVITMDIEMPVMDGINACQRIRQSSLNEHTPIIAVTAHAVDGERARLLTLGFNEFLSKPLDENMLHCSLQEFCPTSRPQSAPASWPASKLVNWPMSLERAGGKCSLMKEMLQMLVNSIPPSRAAIQQAASGTDEDINHLKIINIVGA